MLGLQILFVIYFTRLRFKREALARESARKLNLLKESRFSYEVTSQYGDARQSEAIPAR